jgi:hypothetical protein
MASIPTSAVAAAGLIGGFASARYTGRRELGGAVLAIGGAWCGRAAAMSAGPRAAAGVLGTYLGAFALSHPLAKKLGGWSSVLTVTAVASSVAYALADRR